MFDDAVEIEGIDRRLLGNILFFLL
ncbi:uncharacterized protein METZ01_LOCUS493368 [marine metagenome]|uniref:Uncharacterized protein n=1 Tax=marine metagenome TaxID=408172 RepID=A0A383D876_9ZZZZ